MRNAVRIGVSPRSAYWSRYTADAMYAYLFADGAGANFGEVNAAADSLDYTGTAPTWNGFGALLAGDGGALLPAAVNSVFRLRQECRVVVSAWLMITDATMANQDTVFCAGPDNNTAANLPGTGHFRLQIANLSSNIRAQFVYRNASRQDEAISNQAITLAQNIGNASDTLAHIGVILHSDGTTVDYQSYVNGVSIAAAALTVDGRGAMEMNDVAGQCSIGCAVTAAATIKGSARFGENTDSQLNGLLLWRKNNATAAEAVALMEDSYFYRREASRYL